MALRVSTTGGNWSDAGTWQTITASSAFGASYNTVLTSRRYGAVFTAPNTVNACLGSIVFMNVVNVSTKNIFYCTLQEYNGSTWVDKVTASIDEATLKYDNLISTGSTLGSYLYFKFATPYTYTTTSAGYYRMAYYTLSGSVLLRYDSVSTNQFYNIIIDDRTSAVGATDEILIVGDPNSTYSTVMLDGANTCGSGLNFLNRSSTLGAGSNALHIGHSGELKFPQTMSSSITVNGHVYCNSGGKITCGTRTNPMPSAYTAQFIMKGNTVAENGELDFVTYSNTEDMISFVGAPVIQVGWYSSGSGTIANPLITTTATDWNVGDQIIITGATYQLWEFKFIKIKNSSTSYVLSDTSGGAEAGYSSAHAVTDYIINMTHNVKIQSDDNTKPWCGYITSYTPTGAILKNCEIRDNGGSASSKSGFYFSNTARTCVYVDNCSFLNYNLGYYALYSYNSTNPHNVLNNIVGWRPFANTSSSTILYFANQKMTINNVYTIGGYAVAVMTQGIECVYNNIYVYNALRRSATAAVSYYSLYLGGRANVYNNLNVQGCRSNAIYPVGTKLLVKDSFFGNIYNNNHDITVGIEGTFNEVVFDNCVFGSTNLWSSPLDSDTNSIYLSAPGSRISFTNIGGNLSNNQNFLPEGDINSTGAGLSDTLVRTVGGFPMRFRSQLGTNPLEFVQNIPTGNIQNKTMQVGVWCYIANANYWAALNYVMPRLTVSYDNGTEVYVEAAQIAGSWQFLFLPITPATMYGEIVVTVLSQSDAMNSDAYVYFTDWSILYPAGYQLDLGKQSVWSSGLPIVPTIATNLAAADVWAFSPLLVAPSTIGETVVKTEIKADDASLLRGIT